MYVPRFFFRVNNIDDYANVKFEIDTFFNRVLKSDQPERLKQLITTVGDQGEVLRQELSRSFLENSII